MGSNAGKVSRTVHGFRLPGCCEQVPRLGDYCVNNLLAKTSRDINEVAQNRENAMCTQNDEFIFAAHREIAAVTDALLASLQRHEGFVRDVMPLRDLSGHFALPVDERTALHPEQSSYDLKKVLPQDTPTSRERRVLLCHEMLDCCPALGPFHHNIERSSASG